MGAHPSGLLEVTISFQVNLVYKRAMAGEKRDHRPGLISASGDLAEPRSWLNLDSLWERDLPAGCGHVATGRLGLRDPWVARPEGWGHS